MLLNAQAAGKPIEAALAKPTSESMSCHEKDGLLENTRGKMSCGGCRFRLEPRHPAI